GKGVIAKVDGYRLAVGNAALMERENVVIHEHVRKDMNQSEKNRNSLVLTAVKGELKALMEVLDQMRPAVKEAVQTLKKTGAKELIGLSGDNQGTVDLVAKEIGLTGAHGHMLPEDKSDYIKKLQAKGQIVAFVGDGINDSLSLALADIGIAMGSVRDSALEGS